MSETFSVSPRAAARIAEIVASTGQPASLRVAVLAGGCSGFQYNFDLDANTAPDDLVIERDGVRVVVDPASLDLLAGCGARFQGRADGQLLRGAQPERHQRLRLRHQFLGGLTSPVRIATWNVNGIRAREKNVLRLAGARKPRLPADAGNQMRGGRLPYEFRRGRLARCARRAERF